MKNRVIVVMLAVAVALAAVLYVTTRPRPAPPAQPRPYVWLVETEDLAKMAITLPQRGKGEKWVKHSDQYWYFDQPRGPKVNMQRWGGGIPLILSGPEANRRINADASDEQLAIYGLANPRMLITLTLKDGKTIDIRVGDSTPDQQAYYIRLAGSREVYTVDYSWYDVLERLVLDPPYPGPGGN